MGERKSYLRDLIRAVAGAAVEPIGFARIVEPGERALRVVGGSVQDKVLEPGVVFRFPGVEKIAAFSERPQTFNLEDKKIRVRCGDGSEWECYPYAVLQVLDPRDIATKIKLGASVELTKDADVTNLVGQTLGAAALATFPQVSSADALQAPGVIDQIEAVAHIELQKALDGVYLDEETFRRINRATGSYSPQRLHLREEIERGILVQQAAFAGLTPGAEVNEALQERAGAPIRARGEKIAIDELGENYGVFRRATAIEQTAREGGTVVAGWTAPGGEDSLTAVAATEQLKAGRQRIKAARSQIARARGGR